MVVYKYEEIEIVHLELTTKCNAACPMCARNFYGGITDPFMPMLELSLNDIIKTFPVNFIKQLYKIFMCGNYGDAIVAKDTLEIFKYFRAVNPDITLTLHTNGSAKTPEWWKELAETRVEVVFGIDGLKDTNHLYRRRTNWEIIMRNAATFIDNGGKASWQFIVFKHNQHQIEEAEQLSKEMGFDYFIYRRTSRFVNWKDGKFEPVDEYPVNDMNGDFEYYLEKPDKEHQHDFIEDSKELVTKEQQHEFYRTSSISCIAQEYKSIYIGANGSAYPCCYTGNIKQGGSETDRLIERYNFENDIKTYSLKYIVENFISTFPNYWNVDDKRMLTCGRYCGTLPICRVGTKTLSTKNEDFRKNS